MSRPRTARQDGFTLIELLIVIALMGVLLTLAAPSFRTYSAGQRVKTASFDLYASFIFARSEAIKRRQAVSVTPQTPGDWGTGWRVVAGADTLRTQDPPVGVVLTGSASVDYRQDGRLSSAGNVGILVRPDVSDSSLRNRCIRIDLAGLPKSTEMTGTTCP
jgi:type IV fimbrial biogenesis protein FimT